MSVMPSMGPPGQGGPRATPLPAQAPAPQGANPTRDKATEQRLLQLWMETQDPTIWEYIQSGAPVSAAVADRVRAIVGGDVPVTNVPAAGAPQDLGAPDAGTGNQMAVGGGMPGINNIGLGQGARAMGDLLAGAGAPPTDPTIPASGQAAGSPVTPSVTLPSDPGREDPRTAATPAPGAGLPVTPSAPPVNTSPVSTATPAPGPPPTTGGPVSAQNGGIVKDIGYQKAMGGDQGELDTVLSKILGELGVDVTRPGMYTGDIVDAIQPYLTTFMRYFGLNDGKPAFDRAREAADQFKGIIASPGSYGQIQQYGQGVLNNAGGFLNSRGVDSRKQMGMLNDIMGMLTAGNNSIDQTVARNTLLAGQSDYRVKALDDPGLQYMQWLKQNAKGNPGYDALSQLFK